MSGGTARKLLAAIQRPFILGGIATGVVEAVYYLKYSAPVNISFALPELAAAVQQKLSLNGFFVNQFLPAVNPLLPGIVTGGLLVALLSARRRRQVPYPGRVLALAFIGGVLSGLGTVLAEGDTLYHFIGGVALMQVSSLFMAAFAIPFFFLAVEVLAVLGTAGWFQVDQQLEKGTSIDAAGVRQSAPQHAGGAQWWRGLVAAALLLAALLWTAGAGTGLTLLALGVILGLGVAASGFGIEWSLLVPDAMASSPRYLRQLGLEAHTVKQLRGRGALQAWLLAVGMLSLTALLFWIGRSLPADVSSSITDGRGLHIGHVAGAPLLALGSVMMIGCDLRSYARLGLGYGTALAGIAGILTGMLPKAFWGSAIASWTQSNRIALSSWLPELLSSNASVWMTIWAIFTAAIFVALVLSLSRYRKMLEQAGK